MASLNGARGPDALNKHDVIRTSATTSFAWRLRCCGDVWDRWKLSDPRGDEKQRVPHIHSLLFNAINYSSDYTLLSNGWSVLWFQLHLLVLLAAAKQWEERFEIPTTPLGLIGRC